MIQPVVGTVPLLLGRQSTNQLASLSSLAEFAHNSWKNKTTGQTPFETLMGYTPRAEIFDVTSSVPTIMLHLSDWKKAREEAQRLMIKAQKKWAQRKTLEWTFKIGDQVWLEGQNLHLDHPLIKLSLKRHGPFKIKKVLSPITYQLDLLIQWKIHDVFHINLLTPYQETDFHGPNFAQPPPDLIDGEEEYEIEKILDSRQYGRGCKIQYLVKWKGYPESDNQWANWDNLHAEEVLEDFKKEQPEAPTHIKVMSQGGKTAEPPMSSNDNSTPSFTLQPYTQEGQEISAKLAAAFLSWQPTVPSSWTTPPGSEDTCFPGSPHSNESSPICQDYYIPQTLVCTPDNLCLHAAHTLYSALSTLVDEDTHSHTSANTFPCPTLEPITTTHTWDISHAFMTLYHTYAHEPTALTEYLKCKLQVQCAKQQSHSHSTQVELNVLLEHNTLCHDLHDDSLQGIGYSFDKTCCCGRLSFLGCKQGHNFAIFVLLWSCACSHI